MKYKAGDKVKVKKDLHWGGAYGNDNFVPEMWRFKGETLTIKR